MIFQQIDTTLPALGGGWLGEGGGGGGVGWSSSTCSRQDKRHTSKFNCAGHFEPNAVKEKRTIINSSALGLNTQTTASEVSCILQPADV